MKKINILFIILLLCSCTKNTIISPKEEAKKEELNNQTYIDNNKVKLSIFLYDNNYHNKERIDKTYYTDFISGTDIGSFEVFLTDDKVVEGTNFKNTWYTYYNKYTNIDNIKIGFNIKFILHNGTNFNANYLTPDNYKFKEYFYTYLYDDINVKDNTYYSHLESIGENTLLTSIKIHAVDKIDEVASMILTAFTYDSEDDFDDEGNYRGNSLYVIRIKRK